jgi:hydroxylamine reductase
MSETTKATTTSGSANAASSALTEDERREIAEQAQAMFCFQCEQTAGGTGCTGSAGVCGKTAQVAGEQDKLTGALVGLARAWAPRVCGDAPAQTVPDDVRDLLLDALFSTLTNVSFDADAADGLIARAHALRDQAVASSGDAGLAAYAADLDMASVWGAQEDVRSLKSLILFGLRGVAAYAYHARYCGHVDDGVNATIVEGLAALAEPDWGADELLPLVLKVGGANFTAMQMLDEGNTHHFGTPAPATVELGIEPGPFIIVTGHDLHDLYKVLCATQGTGVNVYSHGELLPAHAYPELNKFEHFKGNFGTAWQNQRREFDGVPAPILYTTNCLMPPAASYADRVFTTGPVRFPGCPHIDADERGHKDFDALIDKAKELGGYRAFQPQTGINGGTRVTTGFGHDAVLGVADKVIEAVKSGQVKHIFLVGGCDGARAGRNYFTEFVKKTPADSLILTLACGKYRFNDLDLGTVAGLPRLLDMGQCNDSYSAVVVALALAEAFGCGVNDLPLTLVLSWYEQKAVSILLSLLNLGIKGIYLGPTLPAFVSPGVLQVLVDTYEIHPTTTPDADLAAILG